MATGENLHPSLRDSSTCARTDTLGARRLAAGFSCVFLLLASSAGRHPCARGREMHPCTHTHTHAASQSQFLLQALFLASGTYIIRVTPGGNKRREGENISISFPLCLLLLLSVFLFLLCLFLLIPPSFLPSLLFVSSLCILIFVSSSFFLSDHHVKVFFPPLDGKQNLTKVQFWKEVLYDVCFCT